MQADYTLWDIAASLVSTRTDRANVVVAGVMMTTPLWLQYLKSVSEFAGMVAPILGCVLVGLQIWSKFKKGK